MYRFGNYKRHYKNILILGIPIVIGQLGIILVGFADSMMVGQYDAKHLAAASFVNGVFNVPIFFGLGFSYGLTPLVGQMYGAKNAGKASSYLKNSLLVNGCIGVLLMGVMGVMYFNLSSMGQPEELMSMIRPYFLLQLVSLVPVMLFNSFKQFSDGVNNTRAPMYIMLMCNVLNIIGNLGLIYGEWGLPEMGVVGAGVSTLVSRVLMLVMFVGVFFWRKEFAVYAAEFRRAAMNWMDVKVLNKMGWMVGIQIGMETSLFSIAAIMIGWIGTMELAAHQILCTMSTFGFMLYYGIGAAMSVRVSNHYGNGNMEKVRNTTKAGLHIILVLAGIASVAFWLLRNHLGGVFTSDEDVGEVVKGLVMILILYQFGDALQIAYANVLRAVGDVNALALCSLIGYMLIAIPMCYVGGFVMDWGIKGVWMGFPIGLTMAGVMFWCRFRAVSL